MLRLAIIALIAFLILKGTTFGWRLSVDIASGSHDRSLIDNLKAHVYELSYMIGDRNIDNYDNLEKVKYYIIEQFKSYNYDVRTQDYILEGRVTGNVIVSKIGARIPKEVIIVGAHYDTCYNPGADDNASGVAAVLELARLLKDKETRSTIKFIAFVNEEPPYFKTESMGSRIYAKDAKRRKENIKAVIILESIGYYSNKVHSQRYPPLFGLFYPNKGNFIGVVTNFKFGRLAEEIKRSFKRHSEFPIESVATFSFISGADFSDHWSFWKEGYPAVMVTDTAFLRNPNYHTYSDTWEKLNYEYIASIIEGFSSILVEA